MTEQPQQEQQPPAATGTKQGSGRGVSFAANTALSRGEGSSRAPLSGGSHRLNLNYGTTENVPNLTFHESSSSSSSSSDSGGDHVPELLTKTQRGPTTTTPTTRESVLNESRRRRLESTRSLRHSSLRDLSKALSRQPSVLSIYSPLEARRVDGGLPPHKLACVVINVIGAGYILLPHAFALAGVVLSTLVLLLVAVQTYVSGHFLLVAGARAEALNNHKSLGGTLPVNYSFALRNRKYEVSHLYRIFMSNIEAGFFTLMTLGELYGISWALISIFATTLAEKVPMGGDDTNVDSYRLYLLVFICFAIPLSCTSIVDQVWVQLVFLACRMVMVLLMLGTIFAAMGKTHFGEGESLLKGPADDIPLFDFTNIVPIVMTSIFSTAYQFSVPCIAASSNNIKTDVPVVFQTATTFVFASNVIVAIFISFYFGRDGTLASSNLMWADYHGGGGMDNTPWWASAISSYVTLFAAIDGAVVYPLLAIALGDIWMGSIYGDDVHAAEENYKIRIAFRMLGCLPQALGAVFLSDLGVIAKYAGICTLLAYTTAPALLFLHSRTKAHAAQIPSNTHYSVDRLASPYLAWFMVVISLIIVGAVVADGVL